MSREEFDQSILEFKKYVILDDRVIDLTDYIDSHPGGRFVLNHCVGKDVSKFFYGGYSLEGNLGGSIAKGHNHSYYARRIANDLTIAIFEADIPVVDRAKMSLKEELCTVQAPDVHTLHLQTSQKKDALRSWYTDERLLGKHFRVEASFRPLFSRHYTVCNILKPSLCQELVKALKENSGVPGVFSDNHEAQDFICITVKNYKRPEGLSATFFQK